MDANRLPYFKKSPHRVHVHVHTIEQFPIRVPQSRLKPFSSMYHVPLAVTHSHRVFESTSQHQDHSQCLDLKTSSKLHCNGLCIYLFYLIIVIVRSDLMLSVEN